MPPARLDLLKRAEWGVRRVHEMIWRVEKWQEKEHQAPIKLEKLFRDLGYGSDNCAVIHYWDESTGDYDPSWPRINVTNDSVKWIALWRPEDQKLMLVLVNWSKEPGEAMVKVEKPGGLLSLFKSGELSKWHDAENGSEITPGKIAIEGWGVKILELN